MEKQILDTIIRETSHRLHSTGIDLNILDLLQAYDQYIKKNKLSIDLKTKVYKGLLKWSRENLHSSSQSEQNSTSNDVFNSDLEFEFRDSSTFDKDAEGDRIVREKSETKDESDVVIQQTFKPNKRMTLPKLTFDNV